MNSSNHNLSGFLLIDKPAGPSSAAVVAEIKRKFSVSRIGHAGTLDPFATGLLILMLGSATRLARYAGGGTKRYSGVMRMGTCTNSDDITGEVLAQNAPPKEFGDVLKALESFKGKISQVPPQISAVKVDGQRAYRRALKGEQIELKPREVQIDRFEIEQIDQQDFKYVVECSGGTYIRSLARDLGAALGCGGCVVSLRREMSLPFLIESAVTLENAEPSNVLPWTSIFPADQLVKVNVEEFDRLQNGLPRAVNDLATRTNATERLIYFCAALPGGGVIEQGSEGWQIALNLGSQS